MTEFLPIEYLKDDFGLICFLINEKIEIKSETSINDVINVYVKLADADIIQCLPSNKVESWILSLFDPVYMKTTGNSNQVFDRLIRKGVGHLIKDQSHSNLSHFIDQVIFILFKWIGLIRFSYLIFLLAIWKIEKRR